MHFTKREIISILLVLSAALLSLGFWRSFVAAVSGAGGYAAFASFLWVSALAAAFFAGMIVWNNLFFRIVGPIAAFLPGLLFVPSWQHLAFSAAAAACAWLASHAVRREMDDRIRFSFFRSARSGQFLLVFAISLSLSSGFFSMQKDATWESLVARFRISDGTAALIMKAAGFIYPELGRHGGGAMTVDGFLMDMRDGQAASGALPADVLLSSASLSALSAMPEALLMAFAGDPDEAYLRSGREQLSDIAGRPVRGDERIADVFAAAIRNRITGALAGIVPAEHAMPSFVPFLLSVLLFLTLLPLGASIGWIWISLAWMAFSVFMMAGWLRMETISRDQVSLSD